MPTRTTQLAAAFLTACACAPAHTAMYRWVDENGVTVYSQTPPPSSNAVKVKKERAPSDEDAAAASKRLEQQREQAFDEEEARKESKAEQETKARAESKRAANCEAARANLENFKNLGRRMVRTPDGSVLRLSEEQVEMEIEKTQMQIEEYCR